MITLTASALSADAFAPFGQVLSAASAARQFTINGGNTERFHDLAELSAGADGRLIVSLFRGQPRAGADPGWPWALSAQWPASGHSLHECQG